MNNQTFTQAQIEAQGVSCTFKSHGIEHAGWIMPNGTGVDHTDGSQNLYLAETISTENTAALLLARRAVAQSAFASGHYGDKATETGEWLEEDGNLVMVFTAVERGAQVQVQVTVSFVNRAAAWANVSYFNITRALSVDADWKPSYGPWRHGGWYVNNTYPSGATGCVSNNYEDGRWRIVCDPRRVNIGKPGDFTFKTRDAAARAERDLIRQQVLAMLAKRDQHSVAA